MPNLADMDVLIVHGKDDKVIRCANSKVYSYLERCLFPLLTAIHQVLFNAIGSHRDNQHHVEIPGVGHRLARPSALDAIEYFIKDDTMLQQELNRLAVGVVPKEGTANPHLD